MKLPGQKTGRVVDTHITTEDILPTIADVLGVDVPWQTTGSSALKATKDKPLVHVGKLTAPYAAVLAQRKRSLARELSLFGSGELGAAVRRDGPVLAARRKAGRFADCRREVSTPQAVVDAVGSKLLRSLPKNSPLVPSPVSGKLPALKHGGMLALGLNGRIAAVAPTYSAGGKLRFSLMPSDSAFKAGRNDVRIFLVSGARCEPDAARDPRHALLVVGAGRPCHRPGAGAGARGARGGVHARRRTRGSRRDPCRADAVGRPRVARPRRAATANRRELRRRRRQHRPGGGAASGGSSSRTRRTC